MPTITPCLWFDGRVQEAVAFYTSVFGDSAVLSTAPYPDGAPGPTGELMMATFRLAGQEFMALNGGPQYVFTPAVSFFVSVETQDEVDYFWDRLCEGGSPSQCGWLVDRFGLSWQIVPTALGRLMGDPDPERAGRVTQAMLGMTKIEIAGLVAAHEGLSG
jgi:predicted 3-demethylubiquinone-9 3-methyltransferase (glyoxalase superfamily)